MRANGPAVCNAACACACAMCCSICVHVLPAALTCARRGTKGGRVKRRRNGETRCGTHSLSMGHSHSLDREGNSAAVLNPANWRNSTTEPPLPAPPFYLFELCPRIPAHYFPLPSDAPSWALFVTPVTRTLHHATQ